MLVRRLIPLVALTLGACDKGSESAGAETDADTDTDSDTDTDTDTDTDITCDVCGDYGSAVPAVVSDIVDAAAADPEFDDFFKGLVAKGDKAVDAFKASLTNFISDAYGCSTDTYTGPPMEKAHKGMNITEKQYNDFVGLCAEQLIANGVPADYVTACFAPTLLDKNLSSKIIGQ